MCLFVGETEMSHGHRRTLLAKLILISIDQISVNIPTYMLLIILTTKCAIQSPTCIAFTLHYRCWQNHLPPQAVASLL